MLQPNTGNVYSLFNAMSKNDYSHLHTQPIGLFVYCTTNTQHMQYTITTQQLNQIIELAGDKGSINTKIRRYKMDSKNYIDARKEYEQVSIKLIELIDSITTQKQ